ncbi:UNVERIFIED_ORG: hypothetical protein ABIC54_001551 [Burkholderia sp. 1263]
MLRPANEGIDGIVPAASLLKSGMPGKDGICGMDGIGGTAKGVPFAPGAAPSERHAFIHALNNCCMPAAGAAPLVPACCVFSFGESVLGEAEECDAAIPAFDR